MRGFKIPKNILTSGLKHAQLPVYLYLIYMQKNGVVDLTYSQIAEALAMSQKSVYNGVMKLIEKGYITTKNKKRSGWIAATLFSLSSMPDGSWVWMEAKLLDFHLSAADLHVYLYIKCRANQSGLSWPSINMIRNDTGLSKQTIIKAIRSLMSFSLLHRQHRKRVCNRFGHNHYRSFSCAEREEMLITLRKKKARTRKMRCKLVRKISTNSAYHGFKNLLTFSGSVIRC